ncbi:MAG TPA: LysR family transcriptional regulator, partial [Caulobacteraceae bacterium]
MAETAPDWDLYRTFLAVVDAGSLSGAARALGIAQPTVGRHIESLEAALGGDPLFTRSPGGLRPT